MPTQRHSHLVVYFLVNLMHPFLHGFSANKWRWLVIAVVVLFIPAVILLGYERQKSGRMARTTFFASGASANRNELSLRKQSRLVSWKISKKHTWNGNVFCYHLFVLERSAFQLNCKVCKFDLRRYETLKGSGTKLKVSVTCMIWEF